MRVGELNKKKYVQGATNTTRATKTLTDAIHHSEAKRAERGGREEERQRGGEEEGGQRRGGGGRAERRGGEAERRHLQ